MYLRVYTKREPMFCFEFTLFKWIMQLEKNSKELLLMKIKSTLRVIKES